MMGIWKFFKRMWLYDMFFGRDRWFENEVYRQNSLMRQAELEDRCNQLRGRIDELEDRLDEIESSSGAYGGLIDDYDYIEDGFGGMDLYDDYGDYGDDCYDDF